MSLPPGLSKLLKSSIEQPVEEKELINVLKERDESPPPDKKKKSGSNAKKKAFDPKAKFRLFSDRRKKWLGKEISLEQKKLTFILENRFIPHLDGMTPKVNIDELEIYQVVGYEKTKLFRLNLNEINARDDLNWEEVNDDDDGPSKSDDSYKEESFKEFLKNTVGNTVTCAYKANDDETWSFTFTVDREKYRFILTKVVFAYTPRKNAD